MSDTGKIKLKLFAYPTAALSAVDIPLGKPCESGKKDKSNPKNLDTSAPMPLPIKSSKNTMLEIVVFNSLVNIKPESYPKSVLD